MFISTVPKILFFGNVAEFLQSLKFQCISAFLSLARIVTGDGFQGKTQHIVSSVLLDKRGNSAKGQRVSGY